MQHTQIVTVLAGPGEVTHLPKGAVVGDCFGGRSFNDNVAAALERRSSSGWCDVDDSGRTWTLIMLDR